MLGQRFFNWLSDQFFPRACVGCHTAGVDICKSCLYSLTPEFQWQSFDFGDVWTAFPYENELVSGMLQGWKYQRQRVLGQVLLSATPFPRISADIIVPVPLHHRRLLERGFNQAELMAAHYAKLMIMPLSNDLVRTRYTRPQAQLNPEARRTNLEEAFTWKGRPLSGHVLLVDDVCTTGSTLRECAKSLRDAGATKVSAICIARGGK